MCGERTFWGREGSNVSVLPEEGEGDPKVEPPSKPPSEAAGEGASSSSRLRRFREGPARSCMCSLDMPFAYAWIFSFGMFRMMLSMSSWTTIHSIRTTVHTERLTLYPLTPPETNSALSAPATVCNGMCATGTRHQNWAI